MNYKENEMDFKCNMQSQFDYRYEIEKGEEGETFYFAPEDYLQSIRDISDAFEQCRFDLIYTLLGLYRKLIKEYGKKVYIESLRIAEVVQLLTKGLIEYVKSNENKLNQLFINEFFSTFITIFVSTKIAHPFQLYADVDLLPIFLVIMKDPKPILLEQIIIFLYHILDETKECLKLTNSIIVLIRFDKESDIFPKYAMLVNKFSCYLSECITNLEFIYEESYDENSENDFIENIFANIEMLVIHKEEEINKIGFRILCKLINLNNAKTQNLVENSEILSKSTFNLLNPKTKPETLKLVINAVGLMCMNDFDMHLYELPSLIQFLNSEENDIINLTSFALCNALKTDKNKGQFSDENSLEILNKLSEIIQNNSFRIISYVGESILGVFKVVPKYSYEKLVQDGIFNTFQIIASVDILMKMPRANDFFSAMKCLFDFADSNSLSTVFAAAFVESQCYSTLAEIEFDDYDDTTNIKIEIDSLLHKIDEILKP